MQEFLVECGWALLTFTGVIFGYPLVLAVGTRAFDALVDWEARRANAALERNKKERRRG